MSEEQRLSKGRALKLLYEHRQSPEVQAMLLVLQVQLDEAKEALVTAEPDRVREWQGRAKQAREVRTAILHGPRTGPGSHS